MVISTKPTPPTVQASADDSRSTAFTNRLIIPTPRASGWSSSSRCRPWRSGRWRGRRLGSCSTCCYSDTRRLYSNDRTAILNIDTATSRDVLLGSPSKHIDLFLKRLFHFVVLVVQSDGDSADLLIGQRVKRFVLHYLFDVFDRDLFLGQHLKDFFGKLFVSDLFD